MAPGLTVLATLGGSEKSNNNRFERFTIAKPPALPEVSDVCRACSDARRCKSSPILMEEKGSEAQGRHCEVGSEGSVEQRYEPTNRNWIGRREGGTSEREITKSISIKRQQRKSSGCVSRVCELTPGGLRWVLGSGVPRKLTERRGIGSERTAEVSSGHTR